MAAGPGGGPHVRAFKLTAAGPVEVASFMAYEDTFGGGVVPLVGMDAASRPVLAATPGPGGGPRVRGFDLSGEERFGYFAPADDLGVAEQVQALHATNRLAITSQTGDQPTVAIFDLPTGADLQTFLLHLADDLPALFGVALDEW